VGLGLNTLLRPWSPNARAVEEDRVISCGGQICVGEKLASRESSTCGGSVIVEMKEITLLIATRMKADMINVHDLKEPTVL